MSAPQAHQNPSDEEVRRLLIDAQTIAVVGASSNPGRPSHQITRRLIQVGYRVIPVNPNERSVLGQAAVPSLESIGEPVDIVDVFRRADALAEVGEQAIRIRAKALWLQQGLWDEGVAARAKAAGLTVVMDNCIAVTLAALQIAQSRNRPRER